MLRVDDNTAPVRITQVLLRIKVQILSHYNGLLSCDNDSFTVFLKSEEATSGFLSPSIERLLLH
jgi:hypothetical protein